MKSAVISLMFIVSLGHLWSWMDSIFRNIENSFLEERLNFLTPCKYLRNRVFSVVGFFSMFVCHFGEHCTGGSWQRWCNHLIFFSHHALWFHVKTEGFSTSYFLKFVVFARERICVWHALLVSLQCLKTPFYCICKSPCIPHCVSWWR